MLLSAPIITSQANRLAESSTPNRSSGTGNTGNISLNAPNGDILLGQGGTVFNVAETTTGSFGKIEITAKNLILREGSLIEGSNLTAQIPDSITITLSERLTVEGNSLISTTAWRSSRAADLTVTAPQVFITEGSFLTSETHRSGQGGRLTLFTDNLQLTTGGQLRSGSTPNPFASPNRPREIPTGAGGTITVQSPTGPSQSIVIDGGGSGIFTDTQGAGAGGSLNLSAQTVTIQNGGTLSASTSGPEPTATGGQISVLANQAVSLSAGGSMVANSTGPANAGNISINAGAQFLSNNGSITTQATHASGGNITIQATDSIRLVNSELSTSVQGGPNTAGGNILIDPAVVTLQNSQVLAQAVQGQGGNINIVAGTFLADQTSVVSASSQYGLSGAVNIQSPISNLSGTLAALSQRPLSVQQLLTQRCAAQANGQLSSLVVAGRDMLPTEPGGWQMSPLALIAGENPAGELHPSIGSSLRHTEPGQTWTGHLTPQLGLSHARGLSDPATGCGS